MVHSLNTMKTSTIPQCHSSDKLRTMPQCILLIRFVLCKLKKSTMESAIESANGKVLFVE